MLKQVFSWPLNFEYQQYIMKRGVKFKATICNFDRNETKQYTLICLRKQQF